MREVLRTVYGLCAGNFGSNYLPFGSGAQNFKHDNTLFKDNRMGTPFALWNYQAVEKQGRSYPENLGENVMKQLCYLFWLAGMATLVAYGWSDTLLNQVSDVVHFMGQLVAFVIA